MRRFASHSNRPAAWEHDTRPLNPLGLAKWWSSLRARAATCSAKTIPLGHWIRAMVGQGGIQGQLCHCSYYDLYTYSLLYSRLKLVMNIV